MILASRYHLFLVVLWVGVQLPSAVAAAASDELEALEQRIESKQAEIASLAQRVQSARAGIERSNAELARLETAKTSSAELTRTTRAAFEAQARRVVEEPELELASELRAYREAARAVEANALALEQQQQQLAKTREQAKQLEAQASAADAALASLRAGLDLARAKRLRRELTGSGEVRVTSTISCEREETIADCIARGEETARRLAGERFADRLLSGATEAAVIDGNRAGRASVTPELLSDEVLTSGFLGQGDYRVGLAARIRSEASLADACTLLGLTPDQCQDDEPGTEPDIEQEDAGRDLAADAQPTPSRAEEPAVTSSAEAASAPDSADARSEDLPESEAEAAGPSDAEQRYTLTVRSNVYYDEVFIDGVPYGSTKLDVLLPAGEYDVEVRKAGHSTFAQRVRLDESQTLRASLANLDEP